MVLIRPFESKDSACIMDIEQMCPQGDNRCAMGVKKTQDTVNRYGVYENSQIKVAQKDDEVVGWIGWTLKTQKNRKYIYLAEVNVHPDYHRQGIATQLVKEVEDNALSHGADHIYCYIYEPNDSSKSLFSSMGYSPVLDVYSAALSNYKTYDIPEVYKIKQINKNEIKETVELINDYYDGREHFVPYNRENFQKYINHIQGYGLENFYVVKENNKVVACGGLWDCSKYADFCFAREPTSWKVMKGVYDFFSHFTKVPYIPAEGEFFKMSMLSNHAYRPENNGAIKALISYFNNLLLNDEKGYLLATLDPQDPLIVDLKDFQPMVDIWSVFTKSFKEEIDEFDRFFVDVRDLIP
ncbi:GNAT family N-acetyltransferase [Methanobacterium alcaliphilum]|uniref:GNAT family N-acetyltransferase n=1 Tax=Methanobacterium alcaliphilum TaxID=392018 RepID=UPI00200B27CF|nr:GNAT family N-acetyltransferase [Methanobacterium alcaliphilum]MCK9152258.1 GNAT family N-acetyltransferase [Methanobacterium alcaliphilum]